MALAARGGRHGGGDHIGQLDRRGERSGRHDGPGDPPGQTALTILSEQTWPGSLLGAR